MAKRKYRVREGFTYGPKSEYAAGAIVELDDATAQFEMDKLELAEIVQNVPGDSITGTDNTVKTEKEQPAKDGLPESAQMTADDTDSSMVAQEQDEREEVEEDTEGEEGTVAPRSRSRGSTLRKGKSGD
jgi:hypothetical protein